MRSGNSVHPIKCLMNEAKDGLTKTEVFLETMPKGDKPANGEVERAVQSVQGLARTIKGFIEIMADIIVPVDHPLMAWIIDSETLLNLFERSSGGNGLTAYQMLRGRVGRVPFPPFGEIFEFNKKTNSKMEGISP